MKYQNIGVMSPGEMGQALALQLKQAGYNVRTALDGRSPRTRELAKQAGLTDVGSLAQLIAQCEVILSVMAPAAALGFAGELAQALKAGSRKILFVDCNAVAPATMQAITNKITDAGSRCVDAGITGPPPKGAAKTAVWVSGPDARELEQFATPQINVRVLSDRTGDASAFKMCYGAMAKGSTALVLELMIAARRLGIDQALEAQIRATFPGTLEKVFDLIAVMPPKAHRFAPEMLEIAQTFESVGMTPRVFQGIAEVFEYVAATRLGKETPETRDKSRTGADVYRIMGDEKQ
jgi:3-hydroxyisobutyrate dehydrogenase-like beta-hydroxyacid dehydrogenase